MKVLLTEDIEKLGWLGDVVEVKNGYARNYLIPYGLATVPTEENLLALADEKARRAEQRLEQRKRIERAAEKVEGAEAVIAAKANEQGHLFGSVSIAQIAANLREQGFEVADEIVKLHEHIKQIGEHEAELKFAPDVTVKVKVTVVAEGQLPQEAQTEEPAPTQQEDQAESVEQEQ